MTLVMIYPDARVGAAAWSCRSSYYGAARRLLRDKIAAHDIQLSRQGPRPRRRTTA